MMLQLLLGGVAGAMVVGKLYWQRFRETVTSLFSGKPSEAARATQRERLFKSRSRLNE